MSNINAGYAQRPNPWSVHFKNVPMVFALAAVLVVVYAVTALQSRSIAAPLSHSALADHGMLELWPMLQHRSEIARALTASFLHLDPGHLASNLLMLLFLGPPIERFFGKWLFLMQTLALSLAWSACVLWMDPSALTVGFSGVIFGYIGLLGYIALQQRQSLVPTVVFMVLNIVFTVATPGVSLWGHLGGAVAGVLLGFVYTVQDRMKAGLPAVIGRFAAVVLLALASLSVIFIRVSSALPAGVH